MSRRLGAMRRPMTISGLYMTAPGQHVAALMRAKRFDEPLRDANDA
jgi:hypothetical protein